MMSVRRGETSETVCDVRKKKKIQNRVVAVQGSRMESVYCYNCGGTVSVSIP